MEHQLKCGTYPVHDCENRGGILSFIVMHGNVGSVDPHDKFNANILVFECIPGLRGD